MSGFFHFLPGVELEDAVDNRTLRRSLIVARGLSEQLRDVIRVPDDVMVLPATNFGTDAARGVTIYPKSPAGEDPRHWNYHPATQTWRQIDDDRWLGWETDSPPTPRDLERKRVVGGVQVLGRGDHVWRVPLAHSPSGQDFLPGDFILTPDGVKKIVTSEYEAIWELSGKIRDYYRGRFDDIEDHQLWKYHQAATILGFNYRIGHHEINALQSLGRAPITTDTLEPLLVNFIDWDLPQELLDAVSKKKDVTNSAAA